MRFSHTVKFPLGKRYEMSEFSMEVEDSEFPELVGRTVIERTRYVQGTLLQMGLAFQVASGYISPESEDFKAQLHLALGLKELSPPSRKVTVPKPEAPKNVSFTGSTIPEKGHV